VHWPYIHVIPLSFIYLVFYKDILGVHGPGRWLAGRARGAKLGGGLHYVRGTQSPPRRGLGAVAEALP